MSFLVRSAQEKDLDGLFELASHFSLLNLRADRGIIKAKIKRSIKSFGREFKSREKEEYLFVVEDIETNKIAGSSLILAKHGTEDSPHVFFKVNKVNKYSENLGMGFIHQVLTLGENKDGPTELGGLLVSPEYRGRPEKLGKLISLIRFVFIAMHLDRFEENLLTEMAPPLTKDGRSEFWEALGRRFTGLSYQAADQMSQNHKEFISSLFPSESIYLCLLDQGARQDLGQVNERTRPALKMLRDQGFSYLNEVDPFDGGPHYGALTKDVKIVKEGKLKKVKLEPPKKYNDFGLVGYIPPGSKNFFGGQGFFNIEGENVSLGPNISQLLNPREGDEVFVVSV